MRPLTRFLATTFAVTWICFIAGGMVSPTGSLAVLRWPLLILGAFAPSIVAVVLTWRDNGRVAARELLGRLWLWRVDARWYAFALLYMAAIKTGVACIMKLGTGSWPPMGHVTWLPFIAGAIVATIFGGPLGEEIGWRGYALPRLAERYGLATGSVILGVIWACWHLPVFFIPGMDQSGQSLFTYIPQVTALSVAMAWLYRNTRGSLLLAVVMHSAINQSKDIVTSIVKGASNPLVPSHSPVAWLTVALLWVSAGVFLWQMSRRENDNVHFSR